MWHLFRVFCNVIILFISHFFWHVFGPVCAQTELELAIGFRPARAQIELELAMGFGSVHAQTELELISVSKMMAVHGIN